MWDRSIEGNLGEERNESIKNKDRVHVREFNAIRKMQSAQLPVPAKGY